MADNYLEKRMEDLRSGRLSPLKGNPNSSVSNKILFSFPSKRIIILDGLCEEGYIIGESFRRIGCKVAFISSRITEGQEKFNNKVSAAGYISCIADTPEILCQSLNHILSQWRGVDLIIDFDSALAEDSLSTIIDYLSHKPAPGSYIRRIITISEVSKDHLPADSNLFPLHFNIVYRPCFGSQEQLKRMVQYLALPEASHLSGKFSFNIPLDGQ